MTETPLSAAIPASELRAQGWTCSDPVSAAIDLMDDRVEGLLHALIGGAR